jgi:rod shape-determining protein MreC
MAPPRNRRPGYSRRAQYSLFLGYVIAVAGTLVAAVLLAVSVLDPTAFSALRAGVGEITAPVSWGIGSVVRSITSIPAGIGSYFGVHGENERLKKEIADNRAVQLRARAIAFENLRLKRLLDLREPSIQPITAARLVSSTPGSTRRFALLYAGLIQGVHAGMPVRGPEGLVGRVLEAGPDTARVMLLIDTESVVPVRRTRDGAPAFVSGRGDGLLDVKTVAFGSTTFKPGDILMTSGSGGVFPPNIPVAKIISADRDNALAKPLAQPDALDFALVQRAYLPMPTPTPEASPAAAAKDDKP